MDLGVIVTKSIKKHNVTQKKKKDNLFFALMMLWPLLHFFVFYFVINFNSVLLSFQTYDYGTGGYVISGLNNFQEVIYNIIHYSTLKKAFMNSLIAYSISIFVMIPLTLLFSFYIYKKLFLSNFFKFMLFLPSIISSIVVVIIFKYFVERFIPGIINEISGNTPQGLLADPSTRFSTIVFYNCWIGFEGSILFYIGSMNVISPEMVEASKIDGANMFREFIHITLPSIYPTLTTIIVTGVVGLFTNQLSLFTFYGTGADSSVQTLGYWLFADTMKASSGDSYPYLSAAGLLMTLIVAPLTFLVKFLMEKYGPSEN